jgi:hypothetical protein
MAKQGFRLFLLCHTPSLLMMLSLSLSFVTQQQHKREREREREFIVLLLNGMEVNTFGEVTLKRL